MSAQKKHTFSYPLSNGQTAIGQFNVYQARNGSICLAMGNGYAQLNLDQIHSLHIPENDLIEFDPDKFHEFYLGFLDTM